MADNWSKDQRSRLMARVRTRDTEPETRVRKLLHGMGYRFRLHPKDLPGSPDIVLPRYRKAVFVHGCFWHGHDCAKGRRPTSNVDFWSKKLDRNVVRDRQSNDALGALGWKVLVIWECQTQEPDTLPSLLRTFLEK